MTRRSYLDLAHGQVHVAEAGAGPGVLLLHQTPRSVDEYREVVPLLAAAGLRAVAMDTPGFGSSDPLEEDSIQGYAAAARGVIAALGLAPAVVVGHHTGGVVAVELAAAAPAAVRGLVLSSTPLVDEAFRSAPAHGVDDVGADADGGHVAALWRGRAGFYPAQRPELLERFLRDALTAGLDRSKRGHAVVRAYRMEERLALVDVPVLLVGAPDDPYGWPNVERMAVALPKAERVDLPGGTVPLPDHLPEAYAAAVVEFVRGLDP